MFLFSFRFFFQKLHNCRWSKYKRIIQGYKKRILTLIWIFRRYNLWKETGDNSLSRLIANSLNNNNNYIQASVFCNNLIRLIWYNSDNEFFFICSSEFYIFFHDCLHLMQILHIQFNSIQFNSIQFYSVQFN